MQQRKKIIFVIDKLTNGGAERVTTLLANNFNDRKIFDVHIISYSKSENEYKLSKGINRKNIIMTSSSRIRNIFLKVKQTKKFIYSQNPDYVVSLATPKNVILLSFISIHRKYKLILSERNNPYVYPKSLLLKFLKKISFLIADGIVFQTEDAKKYYNQKIQKKGKIILNPITGNLPLPYTGKRIHKIVNFCRLEPQKNLQLLIKAFSLIHEKFPDYILEIYGDGPLRDELINYVNKLKIENYVKFYDYSKNIHKKILNYSLYVSSSDYEGLSNSMLEALALGIPTVCTDCPIGGARMVINNFENGVLTKVGDAEEMSKAIQLLLSDEELSAKISSNGIKLRNELSITKIAQEWIDYIIEGK